MKTAIDSLRRQTYKSFELLVQDGASTDGTADFFHSIADLPRLDFQSAPDTGMNQGYNRALERCRGELVYFIAADERLFDHSLETAVSWFSDNPSAAVIYGGQLLIDRNGAEVQRCFPAPFDLLEVIQCKLVPPWAASLFNRNVLDLEDLRSDESMASCADYDLWLRLGSRFESKIHTRRELFGLALADRTSWSFRTESYKQFCKDKCFALERWLAGEGQSKLAESVGVTAKAGIHLWAAEQVLGIEGPTALAFELLKEAALIHPRSLRLRQVLGEFPTADVEALAKTAPGLTDSLESLMQKRGLSKPPSSARPEPGAIDLTALRCSPVWESRIEDRRSHLRLHGGTSKWGYAAQARPGASFAAASDNDYFVKVRLKVISGAIGVCVMNNEQLVEEYIFTPPDEEVACYSPVSQMANFSLILRNAGAANSVAEIYDLCLLSSPKPALAVREYSML